MSNAKLQLTNLVRTFSRMRKCSKIKTIGVRGVEKGPAIKMNYKGTDGEVGFVSAWDSKMEDVGVGEQEIKKLTNNEINTEIRFKVPFESTNQGYMMFDEISPTQTKVKWGMTGSFAKPMNLMMLVMDMDKEVGKDFDEGLGNLKSILEKQ